MAAAAWGQAIDVPDSTLYFTTRLSSLFPVRVVNPEYAAKMLNPGAAISGCNKSTSGETGET